MGANGRCWEPGAAQLKYVDNLELFLGLHSHVKALSDVVLRVDAKKP